MQLPVIIISRRNSPLLGQRRVRQALFGGPSEATKLASSRICRVRDPPIRVRGEVQTLGGITELRVHDLAVEPLLCGRVNTVDNIGFGADRSRDFNGKKVLREGCGVGLRLFEKMQKVIKKKNTN